ncbi:MAG: DNA-3-methyladenine glycosylase family protein [Candidatus Thorarchaeota archaeon]
MPRNYDLLRSVHSWIYPDIQPVPEMTGTDFFARIFRIDGLLLPLLLQQAGPGDRIRLSYPDENVSKNDVMVLARRILGFDIDFNNALAYMKKDPLLEHLVTSVQGIRPYTTDTPFEALVKSVIQQQISYRAANAVTKRMVMSISEKEKLHGLDLYSFPTASSIVQCGLDGLQSFSIGYRSEYVLEVAKLVDSGVLDLDQMTGATFQEVHEILGQVHGIGEWTVKAFMIAGFGDLSIFPFGDLSIQNILGVLYSNGNRMSKSEVIEKSNEWGEVGPSVLYLLMSAYVLGLAGLEGNPKTHKRRHTSE